MASTRADASLALEPGNEPVIKPTDSSPMQTTMLSSLRRAASSTVSRAAARGASRHGAASSFVRHRSTATIDEDDLAGPIGYLSEEHEVRERGL